MQVNKIKTILRNSYKKGKDQPKNVGGLVRDNKLSGQRTQVYHDRRTGQTVVNHRGTQGLKDVITDGALSVGLLKKTNRFKHAQNISNKAKAKYGNNITNTGHSLGGAIAENVKGSKKVVTFNKPVTLQNVGKRVSKKQTDIKTSNDPVSVLRGLQKGNKATVLKSRSRNLLREHSINSLRNKK
jgi:hypothetical protein